MSELCACGHEWGMHGSTGRHSCGQCEDCEAFLVAPKPTTLPQAIERLRFASANSRYAHITNALNCDVIALLAEYDRLVAAVGSPSEKGTTEQEREKAGWKCERCGNCGTMQFPVSTSVYDFLDLLEAAHASESDGLCDYDLTRLRAWPIARQLGVGGTAGHA